MAGMNGPAWLADIIGVLMLASTVYAVIRIVGAWRSGRATDYSIEICHAVMGVSMAGMLIPGLGIVAPGASTWIWVAISSLITLWFAVRLYGELSTPAAELAEGTHRLHHLPHFVLSGAMVYMLAAMGAAQDSGSTHSSMSGSMPGMDMGSASSGPMMPWPTLDLLLAFFMIGYAVLLTDRLPYIAQLGGVGSPRVLGRGRATGQLYAPRGGAGLSIVMSGAMAYMLVMMFA